MSSIDKKCEEIFRTLIGFDTTSCYSNMVMINWVKDYLAQYDIESHLVFDESGDKANLFATIGGEGSGVAQGIALSGHSDVVPIEGQDWSSDPFTLLEKGDKYYGRGTCDMKGFIAVALSLVPEMVAQPLKTPIHLAFSYDEEVGCTGAPKMIAEFGKEFVRPKVVIVGEPSDMQVVSGHKGMSHFHTKITGMPRHSSQIHLGVSSIFVAARLIEKLHSLGEALAAHPHKDCGYEPPHSTISVGIIHGGTADNIVPEHCHFHWETRNVPGENPDDILKPYFEFQAQLNKEIKAKFDACGIVTESFFAPEFEEDLQSDAERLVRALTGDNQTRYVSYCTESGHFQRSGCAVVICGPGSIDQAHRPDEFIKISEMQKCYEFVGKLIDYCRTQKL